MFFSKIYESWRDTQEEKYKNILENIDSNVFDKIVKGKVLDVGSGSGYFEKFLQKHGFKLERWMCLDPDPDMLKESGFFRILGSGNYLPFKPNSFDCVVCLDSIHLIREDFFWVLKPDGFALISLFFNPGNLNNRRRLLKERMKNLETAKEFLAKGRENEIFILARKR